MRERERERRKREKIFENFTSVSNWFDLNGSEVVVAEKL
jgi:hypothetical protein